MLDNWDEKDSTIHFYSDLDIDCLAEFNDLLIEMDEDIDIQETYRCVFEWLLYTVMVDGFGTESYDYFFKDNDTVIVLEYETISNDKSHETNLLINYNIMNDSWLVTLEVDEATKQDYYDYLTDDEFIMQGTGWSSFVNHLSSTLSWDCFQANRA